MPGPVWSLAVLSCVGVVAGLVVFLPGASFDQVPASLTAAVGVPAARMGAHPKAVTPPRAAVGPPAGSGALVTVPAARLLDTRKDGGPLIGAQVRSLPILGRAGIPATNVAAVVLTITATLPTVTGHVSVSPGGAPDPGTSTLNFVRNQTISNTALVRIADNGAVDLRTNTGQVHVLVDVTGWYSAGDTPVPGGFVPVDQRRLVDTRVSHNPLRGTAPLTIPISGIGGVPVGATGVAVNLTGIAGTTATYLTAWPAGAARPITSVLNMPAKTVVANLAVVGLGSSGGLAVAAGAGTTDVVVDLVGYFVGNADDARNQDLGALWAGGNRSVSPFRLLDTRSMGTKQRLGAGQAVEVRASAAPGVPVAGISAVVLTVASTSSTVTGGYLTVWPSGTTRPVTSSLNTRTDRTVAITVIVPVGDDGGVNIYNSTGATHLIVDLSGYVVSPAPTVAPISWSDLDTSEMTGGPAGQARMLLLTANRYALTTWWSGTAPALMARPMDVHAQEDSTDHIRRLSMEAMALAISLRTGVYDPGVVGQPTATAQNVAATLVDKVAANHIANKPGGWGDSWQSSLWSSLAGRAGWMLWDDLTPDTKRRVARMVEWEADQSLLVPAVYLRDRTGKVIRAGNTGAEENAWFALAPALATAMFPNSTHWDAWRHQQATLQLAAWARPSDVNSSTVIDGKPLSAWLGGSNVESNGVIINHSRVAPDYTSTAYQNVDTVMMAALAGTPAPQASLANLKPVYAALPTVPYNTPPYDSPGGKVYRIGYGSVYYPQGCDWGTGQQLPYALLDAQAAVFGFDNAPPTSVTQSALHAAAAMTMQSRYPSGASYAESSAEYTYVGREEHSAQLAAQLYLTYFVQRIGTAGTQAATDWAPGAKAAGSAPRSTTGDRLAPESEVDVGAGS